MNSNNRPPQDSCGVSGTSGRVLHPALGINDRAALELFSGEDLLGVSVDHAFSGRLLGARRGRHEGAVWAVAWGRLTADDSTPAVAFERHWLRRRSLPVHAIQVGALQTAQVVGAVRVSVIPLHRVP
ncbi:hypothetical protein GCM10010211_71260 [Streptomyces albospinus]|uniref:Uncharacterized protein n=1 Tax=Streptomyces albospinus TaxID=285515 RepID=A0ABQ2VKH1_9ACTN|nr:hypothetical protein [Streptomyces albospinus]GGU93980.1 hypothetical protein GCM10010211_71260 [Streptomyces albospinus]